MDPNGAFGNRWFHTMFGLPPHLVTPDASFEDAICHLVTYGEYGAADNLEGFIRDRVKQAHASVPLPEEITLNINVDLE